MEIDINKLKITTDIRYTKKNRYQFYRRGI